VAALVVPLLLALVAVGARTRRRRRRAGGDPADRVAGAWAEALDVLISARVPVRASMTATEVADTAARTLGTDAVPDLVDLGRLANRVHFAPGTVAPDTAARSWSLVAGLRRTRGARRAPRRPGDRRRALLRRIDPRPPFRTTGPVGDMSPMTAPPKTR
jgi:hypothetical protein